MDSLRMEVDEFAHLVVKLEIIRILWHKVRYLACEMAVSIYSEVAKTNTITSVTWVPSISIRNLAKFNLAVLELLKKLETNLVGLVNFLLHSNHILSSGVELILEFSFLLESTI